MDRKELARELHEAGRKAFESGNTVAVVNLGDKARTFLEWDNITPEAQLGRLIQADYLLSRYELNPIQQVGNNNDPFVATVTKEQLAILLNGNEYAEEVSGDQAKIAEQNRLVVVYGYSDDIVVFNGAITDDFGAYNGTTLDVGALGVIPDWDSFDHDREDKCRKYFTRKDAPHKAIKAKWNDTEAGPAWTFETDIPHATFDIVEEGDVFCRGIVFSMQDL